MAAEPEASWHAGGDSGHDFGLGRAEPWGGAEARLPGVCVPSSTAGHGLRGLPAHGHLMPPAPGKPSSPCTDPFAAHGSIILGLRSSDLVKASYMRSLNMWE